MPIYIFQHPKTKKVKEVIQRMSEPHVYTNKGVTWTRLFTIPTASIDTKIDPFSARDFAEKTGKKRGTMGDMWDQSKEASEKRKQSIGHDPVRRKALEDWGKKRNRVHPELKSS